MEQADSSVIIDTKMNNDALEKGFERLKTDAKSLGIACEKAGDKIKMAFSSYDVSPAIQNAIAKLQELQVKFADIATDIQSAPAKRNGLMKQLEEIYTKADGAKQVLYEMQNASKGKYSKTQIAEVKDDVAMYAAQSRELEAQIKRLDNETNRLGERSKAVYAQMEAAQRRLTQAIASEAGKQAASAERARATAQREADRKARAEENAAQRAAAAAQRAAAAEERARVRATKAAERENRKQEKEQERAIRKATKGVRRFGTRFRGILSGALIFNALSSGLRQITSYFGSALMQNKEFSQSLAQSKGAFLTAMQPIYEVAAPALTYLVQLLTVATQALGRFFALLTGKSSAQMVQNAKNLYNQANATKAAGNAAEKAKKQLMGFDEINRLQSKETASVGSSGVSTGTAPDFDQAEVPEVELDEMITYTSGVLLALGLILTFSGANIPLGLGLIALGASGLAAVIAANWDSMDGDVGAAINKVLGTLAIGGLVIGAILAFSGINIPLGIGLMLGGASALGTAVALNWESIKETLTGPMASVISVLAWAALAVGAVFAFSGVNIPLGIALMLGGAGVLGTALALNWDSVADALKGPVGAVVAVVSGAMLALGAVLAFTGVNIPLGIALMLAGAAGLVTVTGLNWDAIQDKMQSVWRGITNWFKTTVAPKLTITYWQDKFSGIGEGLARAAKGAVNSVIKVISDMLNTITWGVNKLMDLLSFNIDIPGLGSVGTKLPHFNAPQIPYLAQGAVLPPNKPFMAVVGDQTHGTNVEAPLSTIQEAVALVMADMLPAIVAGFEEVVEGQQTLQELVKNIEIGDTAIGASAMRYQRRQNLVKGVSG